MESLLESHALDDLPTSIVRGLANFVRVRQAEKLGVTRKGVLFNRAMKQWGNWLALQDIPQVIVPGRASANTTARERAKQSPRISPVAATTPVRRNRPSPTLGQAPESAAGTSSPLMTQRFTPPLAAMPIHEDERPNAGGLDDIFAMDQEEIPSLSLAVSASTPTPSTSTSASASSQPAAPAAGTFSPWKSRFAQQPSTPRVGLRTIMAEAEGRRNVNTPPPAALVGTPPSGRSRLPGSSAGYESDHTPPPVQLSRTPQKSPGTTDKTAGPWRQLAPTPAAPLLGARPGTPTPSGLSRAMQGPSENASPQRPPAVPMTGATAGGSASGKANNAPTLGPTYTPTRPSLSATASGIGATLIARRVS